MAPGSSARILRMAARPSAATSFLYLAKNPASCFSAVIVSGTPYATPCQSPLIVPLKRCEWAGSDPEMCRYHDEEWGVPLHDDRVLFEFLVLEGAQAGLSWSTILRKRDAYRRAFDRFDPRKVARYDKQKVAALLSDAGIVRNRAKIESAIKNAKAFLGLQEKFGTFDAYQWRFVDGRPIQNRWRAVGDIPARTARSDALSSDLKNRGFTFVGSTI